MFLGIFRLYPNYPIKVFRMHDQMLSAWGRTVQVQNRDSVGNGKLVFNDDGVDVSQECIYHVEMVVVVLGSEGCWMKSKTVER